MANIKNLKKNIQYVYGELLNHVYFHEMTNGGKPSEDSVKVVDEIYNQFDSALEKVNQKNVENKRNHYKQINKDLETNAMAIVEKINALK